MANKMITRTVTSYTYTFGTFNPKTLKIEGMEQVVRPYKMGAREEARVRKSIGKNLIDVSSGEALYGMTLDDFMKYAKPITKDDAETGLDTVGNG